MINIDPTTPEGRAKLRELLDTDLTLPLSVLDDGELVGIVDADDHMADRDIDAELAVAAVNALPQLLDALDQAEAAIERARDLHYECDKHCGLCHECFAKWPCATIRVLDGER